MKEIAMPEIEQAIKSIAATALRNEKYFSDLDAAAGDADFGVSLASGFKVIDADWEEFDRSSVGGFLLKISMVISRHVGGCSGPIWGTGFMRAGMLAKEKTSITLAELEQMLSAAIDGIQQRGGAVAGDKTLLDALIPMRDTIKAHRSHQRLGRSTRTPVVYRRAQLRIAGSRDRGHRDDDERHLQNLRCRCVELTL
jgi:dihydroxyacetone kinase